MLTCDAISSQFFSRLGFSLLPGSALAFHGPGASVLLDVLNGSVRPEMGQVTFQSDPIYGNERYYHTLVEVSGETRLRFFATVDAETARLAGVEADHPLIDAALHYFGLLPYRKTRLFRLPAPLRARLRLTPLLTLPRQLWFLDHADKRLDEEGRALLYSLVASRCNRGGIVVMATEATGFMTPLLVLATEDF